MAEIRRISVDRQEELDYRHRQVLLVIERDGSVCQRCGGHGIDVHEIIPRSANGRRERETVTYQIKNMVVLCRACHAAVHNWDGRRELLLLLQRKHGYDYQSPPWKEYVSVLESC